MVIGYIDVDISIVQALEPVYLPTNLSISVIGNITIYRGGLIFIFIYFFFFYQRGKNCKLKLAES